MQKLTAVLLCLTLLLSFTGCGVKPSEQVTETDWITVIRADLYGEDSALSRAMDKAVELKLTGADGDTVTVEVTAPDVSGEVLEWFLSVSEEEYSDAALESLLLKLLKGDTTTAVYELPIGSDGKPRYTDPFLDAASCGVRKFYSALTAMFMDEMEANTDE